MSRTYLRNVTSFPAQWIWSLPSQLSKSPEKIPLIPFDTSEKAEQQSVMMATGLLSKYSACVASGAGKHN